MKSPLTRWSILGYLLFSAFLIVMAWRTHSETTMAIVASSVLMFAMCWVNASHLLGAKTALKFMLIAVSFGWFAEQMGSSHGWFFGSYVYTDVLGWRLVDVPMVIPLMWFALTYSCYVISNLIVWRTPIDTRSSYTNILFMSFLAAMLVTAFDLGADPYMVYQLKAWIMTKTDGWWFGETIQGFFGWVFVSLMILLSFRLSTQDLQMQVGNTYSKRDALLPMGLYASAMVFQLLVGYPVEIRSMTVFVMGIPLLCAWAAWRQWNIHEVSVAPISKITDAQLDQSQYQADPLADTTIADIVGPWATPSANATTQITAHAMQWRKIGIVNRQFEQWQTNASIQHWMPVDSSTPPEITAALQTYLTTGKTLPAWADLAKIHRAETLFIDYGMLSCTLLFCSSLPECYVIPDLSAVLHVAGQLEKHTEYRIRSTAAMIFPVMMKGGLTNPDGSGIAQILKVRLIHATIRNLILRGKPEDLVFALGDEQNDKDAGIIPPLAANALPETSNDMYQALFAHGWRLGEDGLPCNQEELAYTLLTFGYVFLRSLRRLGLGLSQEDEIAYLHTWNVVGHILGIQRELMAETMEQAEAMFAQMQARGRADPSAPDPRPGLGIALMNTMEAVLPFRLIKPFPVLMTRYLCGSATAQDLGIDSRVGLLSKLVFSTLMFLTAAIDGTVRLVLPEFSISRFITRLFGTQFISDILMDQTRPLKLPEHLLANVNAMMSGWTSDPKAPDWMNSLETKITHAIEKNSAPNEDFSGVQN
ncbi:carotenoid biosynthesis protein [Undibacterium sp. Jales W-56]|uniref:carotenoid biosynthesis protein n=1 Tax=Undibacterium sp. Jales W-56 TaxID=2897325 RepID=UPI0021CEA920|nr:carotenoid biosynthesis protein [Undibacterium sp. Jales W-56]MCU6432720.1 carotenoid biosynthesis protein [Undibacterium sp. Jales W-56]